MARFYNFIFFFYAIVFPCAAQVDTEFWFAPPEITEGHGDLPLILRISAQSEPATVRVLQPARDNIELANFTIPANTTEVINLSAYRENLETNLRNTVMKTGLYIVSTAPITAYYEEASFFNAEIFVLKGRNATGNRFIIAAQTYYDNSLDYFPQPYFSFDIVATKDNTVIRVRPTKPLSRHETANVITIRLNKGETYSFTKPGTAASNNPVGTIVESSQPIAITIKDDSVINGVCRDLLGDQLIPVEVTGMEYIVLKGFLTTAEYFFITATENDTHIFMEGNNVSVATLNAGQSRPFNIGPSSMYIRSDKRIYVVHVTGFGCEMGMTVLPPINCTGSRQIGFTRSSSEFFGLNVLVKKEGISHFKLNGSTTLIPPHVFKPVIGTNSTWYTAQLNFDDIQVPVDQSSLIENEKHSFQAGLINGNAITSARYGYFSSFSTLFIGDDFAFCDGATAIIDAGPGKESYLWSTGETTQSISVDATGDYWVKVVREDCELYDTIRINERVAKVDLGPDVLLCEGDTAVVDGKENFSWAWSDGSSEQFLKTTQLGKHWVSVFDDSGCEASDTIMIGRLIYNFAEGIDVKLRSVSVDTIDDKNIELSWSVSELERKETNSVSIYKRIAGSTAWALAAQVPATIEEYQDVGSNSTDDNVYEYYVALANPCGQEQRFSDVHNTVRLQGSGDAQTNLITLNWNYYQLWALGVDRYEIWRKLETEREYKLFSTINGDGYDFFAPIATDAFHHDYIIRSIESGEDAESWSNSIQFDFEHPVYVPNVFTPNEDAYNQTFEITNIQLYHNSKLLVIDRWGVVVYETDGYLGDWNGGNLSSGVYYYILYLNRNDLQPLKGTLSIIK